MKANPTSEIALRPLPADARRGVAGEAHIHRGLPRSGVTAPSRSPRSTEGGVRSLVFCACLFVGIGETAVRSETVALWLFDEPVGARPGSVLNDAGPHGYFLILGRGAAIAPGKFGHALRPVAPAPLAIPRNGSQEAGGEMALELGLPPPKVGRTPPSRTGENANFAALFAHGDERLRPATFANATDSRLNLGAHDWTLEAWLCIDRNASTEGTILEIGSGPRGENQLLTRFSVVPSENAFALVSLSPAPDEPPGVVMTRIDFANPEGPPGGVAWLRSTTLALNGTALPRETWFHVAFVHTAASRNVRLFIDGRPQAVAAVNMLALPHGAEAYVSVGRDGRWQTPLSGAVDELRISDHAVYTTEFVPQFVTR